MKTSSWKEDMALNALQFVKFGLVLVHAEPAATAGNWYVIRDMSGPR